jgi:hypothetical protein
MTLSLVSPDLGNCTFPTHKEKSTTETDEKKYIDIEKVVITTRLPLCIAKVIGLFKDLCFTIGTLVSRRRHSMNYDKVIGNYEKAKGIIVLIHGLNAHPSQMDGHFEAFEKSLGDEVLIYQVQVFNKGNCSKSEAIKKITETVLPILQDKPNMKLYAHGVSNGGWLSSQLAIDVLQKGIDANRIMVNSSSSPFYGTKVICDPKTASWQQKIWKWILQSPLAGRHAEVVYQDFCWGSDAGKKVITNIQLAAQKGVTFEFEGCFADSKVTPPSFYPKNVLNAQYFYPNNIQGHSSIIASQRPRQVESAKTFIQK